MTRPPVGARLGAGFALKSLVGPYAFVVTLGVDLQMVVLRGAPYLGDPVWTVSWMVFVLWVFWIIGAALAAVDAARLSRPGSIHLPLAARRGRWIYAWAAGWTALPMVGAHVLVIAGALAWGGVWPRVAWWQIGLALGAQSVTLIWFVCLGSFLGRFMPVLLAGPLAGALAYAISQTVTGKSFGSDRFAAFGDGGATMPMIGLEWNATFHLLQIALLGGTGFLLLLPLPRRRVRLAPGPVAVLTGVSVVLAVAVVPAFVPGRAFHHDAQPPDRCVGADPMVCTYREHERYAATARTEISKLTAAARAQGYDSFVRTRYQERSRSYSPGIGEGAGFEPLERGRIDPMAFASGILTPTWCPAISAEEPPPNEYFEDLQRLAVTWVHLLYPEIVVREMSGAPVPDYSPAEAQAVVNRFAACDLDR